jgi:hypothetical protein
MNRNRENATQLTEEMTENELQITQCRADLEEDPRSQPLKVLLGMHLERRLALEQRFRDLGRNRFDRGTRSRTLNRPMAVSYPHYTGLRLLLSD